MAQRIKARKTARDLVADYLRPAILIGELPPGRKLNVAEVAEELEVSHTPTREALQLLASEGLVRISAYRGAHVAELSADEYEEIFLMRIGLECLAARLGAERISDEDILLVKQRFDALVAAAEQGDVDEFVTADREFHRVHYEAADRERLWERIIGLRSAAERYTRLGYSLPTVGMTDTTAAHRRLLKAVVARDGDTAEREIEQDLRRTFEVVHAKLVEDEQALESAPPRRGRRQRAG
jgi:GntR family transcriptional regulator, rspAB operon transcriptional repressor